MIPILYERDETTFTSNGICRLRDCTNISVAEELNSIYEIDFDYPVDGVNYSEIRAGRIVAITHDNTGDIQPFDIVSHTKPINGVVSFHCVHISYRLTGIVFPTPFDPRQGKVVGIKRTPEDFWEKFMVNSEPVFSPSNQTWFTFESDITTTAMMTLAENKPYNIRELLGGVEGSLLDAFHCEYEWDKFTVKMHKNRGQTRNFVIRYGVNLTDYNDETDYSGAYNTCVPYWTGDNNGENILYVPEYDRNPPRAPLRYVESGNAGYNGRKVCAPLNLSDQFETKPTAAQMEAAAKSYMNTNKTYNPAQTISVNFVQLADSEEYRELAPLMQCALGDTVKVVFPRYGIEGNYKVVKIVWNPLLNRYDEMELGNPSVSLSEAMGIGSSGSSSGGSGAQYIQYADYVSSKGTSGSWTYRKWKSGKVEAWATLSKSVAITTQSAAYGGYRTASEITYDIPSGIFDSAPDIVLATKSGSNSARIMNMHANSATKLAGYFSSAASETLNCSVNFYVVKN